jgi:hypothetical protein
MTADTQTTMPLADIKVGERFRKDMGDIDGLAAKLKEVGALLHPIVVRSDGTLIAGERRQIRARCPAHVHLLARSC